MLERERHEARTEYKRGFNLGKFKKASLRKWESYSTLEAKVSPVLSKLNPESLELEQTWRLTSVSSQWPMSSSSVTTCTPSALLITWRQLCLWHRHEAQQGSHHLTHEPYSSLVDYKPLEKKLFAWDNFNMVTYDIKRSKMWKAYHIWKGNSRWCLGLLRGEPASQSPCCFCLLFKLSLLIQNNRCPLSPYLTVWK